MDQAAAAYMVAGGRGAILFRLAARTVIALAKTPCLAGDIRRSGVSFIARCGSMDGRQRPESRILSLALSRLRICGRRECAVGTTTQAATRQGTRPGGRIDPDRLFAVRLHRPKPDAGLRNAGADCGRGACDLLRRGASGHFAAELAGPMDRPHQLLALSRPLAHPRVRAIHIDARPDETRGRSGFLCLRSRRLADVGVRGNAIPAAGWPRLQNQLSAPPCGDGGRWPSS